MTQTDFTTTDIHLACYILSTKAGKFRGIEWQTRDKAVFIFRPGPGKDIAAKYLNGGEAPARMLFDSLRFLRTQLNETRFAN